MILRTSEGVAFVVERVDLEDNDDAVPFRQEGGGTGPATDREACRRASSERRSSSALRLSVKSKLSQTAYGCIGASPAIPHATSTDTSPAPGTQTAGPLVEATR